MDFALDAVIDAIENNQIKNALNLCEKGIKKWPLSLEFKALQALAFWYSGNESVAESSALSLANLHPKDHFTISVIERVLEFSDNFKALSDLCENAVKDEFDERIAEKIYHCHLRLQNTGKLYSIATKLFNASKNQIYLYWAVVGLILEIQNGPSSDKRILIELCKRTFQKIYKDHNGNLGIEHKKLGLLIDEIAHETSVFSKIEVDLPLNNDQFDHLHSIINSKSRLEDLDIAAEMCLNYLNSIPYVDSRAWSSYLTIAKEASWESDKLLHALSVIENKNDQRGINYASVALKIHFPDSIGEELSEMIFNFCLNLISKPSTLSDVVYFLRLIDDDQKHKFYVKIIAYINLIESEESLVDLALFLHLHRFLSVSYSYEGEFNQKIKELLNHTYINIDSLRLDKYYRVALYRCLIMIDNDPSESAIIEILESYSQIFMDRYVFGLLLLILLLSMGNFERAYSIFKGLDIKCIQLDTLGYLVSDSALYALDFCRCENIYSDFCSLYASNRNDTWSLICQSIENNAFVSVVEFFEFFRRLEFSRQFVFNELLFLKCNLLKLDLNELTEFFNSRKFYNALKILHKEPAQLVDNRDFAIFDSIDPTGYLKSVAKSFTSHANDQIYQYRNIFSYLSTGNIVPLTNEKDIFFIAVFKIISADSRDADLIISHLKELFDYFIAEFSTELEECNIGHLNYQLFKSLSEFLLKLKIILLILVVKMRNSSNQTGKNMATNFYCSHISIIIDLAKVFYRKLDNNMDERSKFMCNFLITLEVLFIFNFDKVFSSKRHRIFSKALLTDYAVVEELDFEVTFDKIYHRIEKFDSASWIGELSILLDSLLLEPVLVFENTIVAPLRANRTDRTEAIMISAPYITEKGRNICGTSIILTVMEYLKRMNFLSRDVIFVFPRDKAVMEKFVDSFLNPEIDRPLEMSNNILAAVNVEIDGNNCHGLESFNLKYESEEIVPFMDFVNTLTKIADFQGIDLRFDERKKYKLPKLASALLTQYAGYLNSSHSILCKSKIDAITIKATGRDYSDEHDNIQEFYKFMISSIRSFCNAIGHFQHETAIYFPSYDNNYYEFADYIGPAILILLPPIILSLLELYAICGFNVASKSAFEAAIGSSTNYFNFFAFAFISSKMIKFERLSPSVEYFLPYAMILMEILGIFVIRKFGPKMKHSRLISGIILFVYSFALMFTSLGTGLVLYSMAALLCFLISLSKLSNLLNLVLIPFISPTLYLKVILQVIDQDTPFNLIKLWNNNYIILFIYPAILLLCCQIN